MKKKKKPTFTDFEMAVREARTYVNSYEKVRFKIVDLALSVCDTKKGGRKPDEVFSIKKFADAIDLADKTLYTWIRVKTYVVDKLPAVELKDKSKYNFDDLRRVGDALSADSTKKEVLTKWREVLGIPSEAKKFVKYERALNSILHNAQRPLNLLNVESHYLEKLVSKCTVIAKLFNKELELRERLSKEERLLGKSREQSVAIAGAQMLKGTNE